MLREFVVEGDAEADVPEADATLTLGARQAAPELEAGERTIELRNDRDQPSSVFLTAFEPGRTEKDLERWETSGMRGPAPARLVGGTIDVPPRTSVYYTVTLEEGREYTLLDDETRHPNDLHTELTGMKPGGVLSTTRSRSSRRRRPRLRTIVASAPRGVGALRSRR